MPNVSNLKIKLQTGSNNLHYATWDFTETYKKTVTTSSGGSVRVGDWVTIKSGATWYNGVGIDSWVFNYSWKVYEVRGDRAVLNENGQGNYIMSPIHVGNLNGGSGGGSTSTEVTVTTNYLDHYEVNWYYATGDGIWFDGSSSTNEKNKYSTYSPPSNAKSIKVSVKPVSKTYRVNDSDVSYWTGSWVSTTYYTSQNPPSKPSTPTVSIDKYKLTATINNVSDPLTDKIQFEVYNRDKKISSGTVTVSACMATYSCAVTAGGEYRVHCRAVNITDSINKYSEWTDFTNLVGTIPTPPEKITELRALSETSVYIDWTDSTNAKSYKIEYTTKKSHFDTSTDTKTQTVDASAGHAEITGLESGQEYFFRVCAVNDKGSSAWCEIQSVIIGKTPAAPTTWSSTTTAIVGESLTLYWVHNSQDGSSQKFAELELTIDGVKETHTLKNTTDEDLKDKTSSYSIDTKSYSEGSTIQWRVRTTGITNVYGDWSVLRTIDIYAPVTLELSMTDVNGAAIEVLNSFPFYISALAGPKTQRPIGYYVSITSSEIYDTTDNVGNNKVINNGEELYSKFFDITDPLLVEMSANNIDLENNVHYKITCTVSMNSGLTGTATLEFEVNWSEKSYEPDAEIGIDMDTYSAYINPYCLNSEGKAAEDILLSVYRREFDGRFTEIATGIDQLTNTVVVDPHPALDYARYRIVATTKNTGAVSYYDPPGYPVGGKAIIIQWNEEWSNFDATADDVLETPPWSGSLLTLPYNVDVSDNNSPDVAFAEYIGRENPVSYYGTQLGSTATWNTVIDKKDKETLYALRRLQIWMGDAYVREPSGSGYWANIEVSFSQKHTELTIPVTLDITRVEGGV